MIRAIFTAVVLAAASFSACAQQEGPTPTQTLVTVDAKTPTIITLDQVEAQVNNRKTPLLNLSPVPANGLQVAILIDDGLRTSVGTQLIELRNFVRGLRPGTEIYVGYMQNGRVIGPAGFTTDLAQVAQQVRLPLGRRGISASPYFCLTDFLKRWPGAPEASGDATSATGKARVVLMLTNGVDPYNGSVSPLNQNSPYVDQAAASAQRAGVQVYSIYYGDAGVRGNFASLSGQSYLQQMAESTGGQSFYQGTWSPVSIAPFLKQFQAALSETYVATFPAVVHGNNTLVALKLSTKLRGTRLHAPSEVHPGTAILTTVGGAAVTRSMAR